VRAIIDVVVRGRGDGTRGADIMVRANGRMLPARSIVLRADGRGAVATLEVEVDEVTIMDAAAELTAAKRVEIDDGAAGVSVEPIA
jgi:hypothetical protein